MSGFSSSGRNARRPRASNTCQPCRRKKLKCDQARPVCARCANTPGLQCSYERETERGGSIQFVGTTVAPDAQQNSAGDFLTETVPVPAQRLQQLEDRIESLTGMVQRLQSSQSSEALPPVSPLHQEDFSRSNIQYDPLATMSHHLNSQAGGRTRYVSKAYWACLCEEVGEIDELLRSQTRYDARPEAIPNWRRSKNPTLADQYAS